MAIDDLSIVGVSFKLGRTPDVIIRNDGTSFRLPSESREAKQYAAWLAAGNTVLPADPPSVEENAYAKEVTDKDGLVALVGTLLPPTYDLTQLNADITSLKAFYVANPAPTLANLMSNLRTSLRVEAFMVRWIARNRPR